MIIMVQSNVITMKMSSSVKQYIMVDSCSLWLYYPTGYPFGEGHIGSDSYNPARFGNFNTILVRWEIGSVAEK